MTILYCVLSLILGYFIGFFTSEKSLRKKSSDEPTEKFIRRGIYKKAYIINRAGKKHGDVEVVYEIGELESTSKLSKISVISLTTDRSEYNTDDLEKRKLVSMVEGSWVESNDIEWINTTASDRDKKIDEILK